MSHKERLRAIIKNECFLQDIEPDFITKGCEYAIYEFEQSPDFAHCVNSGISVAKKCQYNAKWSIESMIDTSIINQTSPTNYKQA